MFTVQFTAYADSNFPPENHDYTVDEVTHDVLWRVVDTVRDEVTLSHATIYNDEGRKVAVCNRLGWTAY